MKKIIILLLIIAGVGFIIYGLESPEDNDPEENNEITEREVEFIAEEDQEAQQIKVIEEDSNEDNEEEVFSLTIDDLNEWTENNWDQFDETPQVGPNNMNPGDFNFFDREASISPDNNKLAFSVSGYAALSTTSLVVVADLEEGEMDFITDPARGTVDEYTWSDDSTKLAYTLGTARAQGDYLRVDSIENMSMNFELEGEDLLEILEGKNEATQFLPIFNQLKWEEDQLKFTTEDPESDERLNWVINSNGENLTLE